VQTPTWLQRLQRFLALGRQADPEPKPVRPLFELTADPGPLDAALARAKRRVSEIGRRLANQALRPMRPRVRFAERLAFQIRARRLALRRRGFTDRQIRERVYLRAGK
jgi:hypothetical protein